MCSFVDWIDRQYHSGTQHGPLKTYLHQGQVVLDPTANIDAQLGDYGFLTSDTFTQAKTSRIAIGEEIGDMLSAEINQQK